MCLLVFCASNEYQENGKCLALAKGGEEEEGVKDLDHPAHISEKRVGSRSVLRLDITDPLVTKRGQALHHLALLQAHSQHAAFCHITVQWLQWNKHALIFMYC